jgi:large subunit ribosomal protein L13
MKFYDAESQILGRMCSKIAKELLKGEKIVVVNAEKAVISGNPKAIIEEYKRKRERGDPKKGPFFPRYPDQIFRRTVRGMLPWHKPKGRKALKNLRVYIGIPTELKNKKFEKIKEADVSKLRTKYITLEKVSLALGAKKRW